MSIRHGILVCRDDNIATWRTNSASGCIVNTMRGMTMLIFNHPKALCGILCRVRAWEVVVLGLLLYLILFERVCIFLVSLLYFCL